MKQIILLSSMVLWALAFKACGGEEEKTTPKNTTTIVGTWKCIGFGTVGNDKIKEIEPKNCAECYKITFNEDGTLNGNTSTNEVYGTYNSNLSTYDFVFLSWGGTEVNELLDGHLYVESMRKVTKFNFSKEGELLLYYNDKKEYLIFKPKQQLL